MLIVDINHDCIFGSKNRELVISAGTKLEITSVSAIRNDRVMLSVKIKEEN